MILNEKHINIYEFWTIFDDFLNKNKKDETDRTKDKGNFRDKNFNNKRQLTDLINELKPNES